MVDSIDKSADGPKEKDSHGELVMDIFSRIDTFTQGCKLYSEEHKKLDDFANRAFETIEPFLTKYGDFSVSIKSSRILYGDFDVYSETERDGFCYKLHQQGVKKIIFINGLQKKEFTRFLKILGTNFSKGDNFGHDIVTLLWEECLENIHYTAIETFSRDSAMGGGQGDGDAEGDVFDKEDSVDDVDAAEIMDQIDGFIDTIIGGDSDSSSDLVSVVINKDDLKLMRDRTDILDEIKVVDGGLDTKVAEWKDSLNEEVITSITSSFLDDKENLSDRYALMLSHLLVRVPDDTAYSSIEERFLQYVSILLQTDDLNVLKLLITNVKSMMVKAHKAGMMRYKLLLKSLRKIINETNQLMWASKLAQEDSESQEGLLNVISIIPWGPSPVLLNMIELVDSLQSRKKLVRKLWDNPNFPKKAVALVISQSRLAEEYFKLAVEEIEYDGFEIVLACLDHADDKIVAQAIRSFRDIDDKRLIVKMKSFLSSSSSMIKVAALRYLANNGDKETLETGRKYLLDFETLLKDSQESKAWIKTYARLNKDEMYKIIEYWLSAKKLVLGKKKAHALYSLALFGYSVIPDERSIEGLEKFLKRRFLDKELKTEAKNNITQLNNRMKKQ